MKYSLFKFFIALSFFLFIGCNNQSEAIKNEQQRLNQELIELKSRIIKLEQEHALLQLYTQSTQKASAKITIHGVHSKWVNNKSAGELFVIKGIVTNNSKFPKSKIQVIGKLYDKKGRITNEQIAFCGNSIEEDLLQNLTLQKLNRIMKNSERSDLKPITTAPFTIVFSSLGKELNEFTAEIVQTK